MNDMDGNENILINRDEQFQYSFDATAFLTVLALLAYSEHDKQRLTVILQQLQAQDIIISETIKKSGTEIAPLLATFLNTRITENRASLKLTRLFGFMSPGKTERLASDLAFAEGAKFVKLVTLSNDPAFQKIITDRQAMLKEIFKEIQNLVDRGKNITVNPQKLQELIKWLNNKNLLT